MTPKKTQLIYKCAVCNEMVTHDPGPYWLETGTILFCPQCDGATIIILQRDEKQNEKARAAIAKTEGVNSPVDVT